MTEKTNSHANPKYCGSRKSWGLHTEREYESTYFTLVISIIIFADCFFKKSENRNSSPHAT